MTARIFTPVLPHHDKEPASLSERLSRWDRTEWFRVAIVMLLLVQGGFAALALAPRSPLAGFTGSESYSDIARNWMETGNYSMDGRHPTAYRPPLYPALLAVNMRLLGVNWRVGALIMQAALGVVCGLLLFHIATNAFKKPMAGIIAVVLYLSDLMFQLEAISKRETVLYTALLLAFFCLLLSRQDGTSRYILLALLGALAYLTRPVGIVLMILLPLFIFIECRKLKPSVLLARLGAAFTVMVLVIAPWQLYVYKTFHTLAFWPTSTAGINAFQGNNPATEVIYPYMDVDAYLPWVDKKLAAAEINSNDEVAANRFLGDAASQFSREHPGRFLKAAVVKTLALFSPVPVPLGKGRIVETNQHIALVDFHYATGLGTILFTLHGVVMLIGAMLFFIRSGNRISSLDPAEASQQRRAIVFILLFLSLVTLMHVLTFAETRFRLPLDMFLILLAALAYSPRGTAQTTVATHG